MKIPDRYLCEYFNSPRDKMSDLTGTLVHKAAEKFNRQFWADLERRAEKGRCEQCDGPLSPSTGTIVHRNLDHAILGEFTISKLLCNKCFPRSEPMTDKTPQQKLIALLATADPDVSCIITRMAYTAWLHHRSQRDSNLEREFRGYKEAFCEGLPLPLTEADREVVRQMDAEDDSDTIADIIDEQATEAETLARCTDRVRKVIKLAEKEAEALGDHVVGTEHVLLGLIRENSGVAAAAMKQFTTLDELRDAVMAYLGHAVESQPTEAENPRDQPAIGDEVTLDDGTVLLCVAGGDDTCIPCYLNTRGCQTVSFCGKEHRKDGKDVHFIRKPTEAEILRDMQTNDKPFCDLPEGHQSFYRKTCLSEPERCFVLDIDDASFIQDPNHAFYKHGDPGYVDVEVEIVDGYWRYLAPGERNWSGVSDVMDESGFLGYVIDGELLTTMPLPVTADMKLRFSTEEGR